VGQQRTLVPNGLFAVVKQRVHDFLVVQRKANPKEASNNSFSYHKISTLRGITSDGLLGNFKQILKANVGITTCQKKT
jgi:hypothetical protein